MVEKDSYLIICARKTLNFSSSETPVRNFERKILPVSQHTRFEVPQKKEQFCHQVTIKSKCRGCVGICATE